MCSLHFSEYAFETNNGKIRLKNGAIPTEFWVDIIEAYDDVELDRDDETQESDIDLQLKYNELKQSYLKMQTDFNVREASLLKKMKIWNKPFNGNINKYQR